MKEISARNSFLLFIALLLLLEIIIYRDFIFGDYLYIFKDAGEDSYTAAYPDYVLQMRSLAAGKLPEWSFCKGMGSNTYPFWIEPVGTSILYFFFINDVAAGMIWVQLAHTFLAGICFYGFLRSCKLHYLPTIVGGLLYAFSSYMIANSTWMLSVFSVQVTNLAFLLFALEQFVATKRWYFYPIAVGFIAMQQPFDIYFAALLTLIYLSIRIEKEQIVTLKIWIQRLSRLTLLGLLGLGLSAVMLLSNLNQMRNSPRGKGEVAISQDFAKSQRNSDPDATEFKTTLLRFFSSNMEGSAIQYKGWYNYFEAPILYTSLFVLLLIPQLFFFIKNRERKIYAIVLLAWLLVCFIPNIRQAVWLFSGNYYRTIALLTVVLFLFFSMRALDFICKGYRPNVTALLISFGIYTGLLLALLPNDRELIAPHIGLIIAFFIAHTAFLYLAPRWQTTHSRLLPPAILLGLVSMELIVFSVPLLGERKPCTHNDIYGKKGYNDSTVDALKYLNTMEKGFYRVEKDYHSGIGQHFSYNDARIQNYFGTRNYHSFNSINYVRFLKNIGEIRREGELSTRWVEGLLYTPIGLRLCGAKYILGIKDEAEYLVQGMQAIHSVNSINIFKINNTLPLGFTYDKYVEERYFLKFNYATKQRCMMQAAVIDNDFARNLPDIQPWSVLDTTATAINQDTLANWVKNLKQDTLSIQSFDHNHIKGNISLTQPKILFLSIPCDEGWQLTVNGKPTPIQKAFSGLMGVHLPAGTHQIDLHFEDPYRRLGAKISLFALFILIISIGIIHKRDNQLTI